ncbi:MAG TPA: hypothetical protein VGR19_07505, partial [Allosphingosinicella sp.]|nr:hypothetical protein [Allosphingosinicella sp.]
MQATLATEAPHGDKWLHELKYDGYRTQIIIDWSARYAFTRRGFDWSARYDELLEAARYLECASAVLDGEVIVQDPNGLPDFHRLQRELRRQQPEGLIFMAFDLLHLDGKDLRNERLEDRRALLQELLGENDPERPLHFSSHVVGGGPEFFRAAEEMGLEGIVSKKLGSRYRSGPSKSWLKVKAFTEGEFVVIGTSRGDKAPVALLAAETDEGLSYAGAAMVTLPDTERDIFWRTNEALKTAKPAIAMEPRKETSWLRPEMKVRVRHLKGEEMLRHATVQATAQLPSPRRTERPGPSTQSSEPSYPNPEMDREALREYYRGVAPLMLPWVAERPLNLFRCPGHECFFQRNRNHPPAGETFQHPIETIPIEQKNGKVEEYLYVTDAAGILAAVDAHA